ncbi:hypothetical protein GH714_011172 [Hevea brasiliensis]|uniref:hAT-like transposase RNase-H fold domain-containing protein n=1 Tax=Hevea brasiliensis TaxID=3981 RepID=A0A6A6M7R4_HEVBR|nr:hypothetical protein GH714_011172 [Hevea brasiliensis]
MAFGSLCFAMEVDGLFTYDCVLRNEIAHVGNAAFKGKQWNKVINYSEAIKLNGTNATYYCNWDATYLELGCFQQAKEDCSKAISLDKRLNYLNCKDGTTRNKTDSLMAPLNPLPIASSQTKVGEATSKMKRKGMKLRLAVWDHFSKYAIIDPCFKLDLQSDDGLPDSLDWEHVRRVVDFLSHFYDLTLRISGSRYVTSNIFFNEISSVDCLLQEWQGSDNMELACMGDRMKAKFDKYWGDPDKMNKIINIVVVVDP